MDNRLYSISQIRILEKTAVERYQVPEFILMSRAGQAAFQHLRTFWPDAQRIKVICGSGNNGGDGFVLAKCAKDCGLDVEIRILGESAHFSNATQKAVVACQLAKIRCEPFISSENLDADVIVDALLGIGLNQDVAGLFQEAIIAINQKKLPVLAIDVPSGIDADTGNIRGVAIKAATTITFLGFKAGLFTQDAVDYCGTLVMNDLQLPADVYQAVTPAALKLYPQYIKENLPPRRKNSHKGDFGHVLIVGGNKGMAGAARLAAEAALRTGAGLVSVASLPEHQSLICSHYPEIMCHGVTQGNELHALLTKATVVVIGPGLGNDSWGKDMLEASLNCSLPKVIDADGLNLLSSRPNCQQNWVMTPHPGEAARLLDCDNAASIQENRFEAMNDLASLGGTWILKGIGTLIKEQNSVTYLCPFGNPGMASGGMGDALSGIVAGLIAQRLRILDAAKIGVLVHALAGDKGALHAERGLVASDVISLIRCWVNP